MNSDQKQRFFFTMLIALTAMVALQFILPEPETPRAPEVSQHGDQRPAAAAAAPASATPPSASGPAVLPEIQADTDYTVTVRVGEEGINARGYEAVFSSVGGGLSRYRLLGFFRVPLDASPENRITLLDRMAPGRDSLRIDNVSYGSGRQAMERLQMRETPHELVEAPAWAEVSPEPGPDVVRGERLVFRTVVGEWEVRRVYTFPGHGGGADFTVNLALEWRNLSESNQILSYDLVGPAGLIADDDSAQFSAINILTARQPSPASASVEMEQKLINDLTKVRYMADKDNRANLAWVGSKNRFFVATMSTDASALTESDGATRLLFPGSPAYMPTEPDVIANLKHQPVVTTNVGDVTAFSEVSLTVEAGVVRTGESYQANYLLYAGPAVDAFLGNADDRLAGVVHYSWSFLDYISRFMVRVLTFLDRVFGNYGVAIIVMTIIIKLILHPLNRKSFVSMNKMSKLAPQMKEIQKKYGSDRAKMQVEMSKFYKENGVSMAGGCLPVFLQLPIFIALYGAFSQGFSMRHAPFLAPWIKDLSKPDSLFDFGFSLPIVGWSQLSLLPILYFILQYIQMSLQPKPSDPQQAQQQKIMKIMPLMFVFIFYSMPAGLVLYFTISALCGVAENAYMRKILLPKLGLGDVPAAGVGVSVEPSVKAGSGAAGVQTKDGKHKKKKK
ncbi:MAG: membrane protein insertase YidC [Planctomycetaceae bacterium]|nr:membrane protein insertase YidC [Planctomycetaceae bacterium]